MHLYPLDWIVAATSILICFVPALFFVKRSGKSTAEFFASGRSVPWWLAGLSMVATTLFVCVSIAETVLLPAFAT